MSDPYSQQELDDAFNSSREVTAGTVRANLANAVNTNPDQVAQEIHLARSTDMPLSTVQAAPDAAKSRAIVMNFGADDLTQQSPKTAQFLTDPNNAKIAHDDVPNLAKVEAAVKGPTTVRSVMDSISNADTEIVSQLAKGAASSYWTAAAAWNLVAGGAATLQKYLPGGESIMAADALGGKTGSMFGSQGAVDSFFKQHDIALNEAAQLAPGKDAGFMTKASFSVGNMLGLISQIFASGGAGAAEAKLATEVPSAATAVGEQVAHGVKSMMFPSLSDAINTGQDVYKETGDWQQAAQAAQMKYLTSTLGGVVPMSMPGNILQRAAAGAVSGVATGETSRELMNTVLPAAMRSQFSPEELGISALSSAVLGGVTGPKANRPEYYDAVRQTYLDAARVDDAEQGTHQLYEIGQAAAAAKLRERDPAAFKQFVADVAQDSNIKTVYVDPETLNNALHQSKVDPEQFRQNMPEVAKDLDEAMTTKTAVAIPIEDYAAHIAGSPLEAAILPELRTAPDAMNYKEALAYRATETERQQSQVADIVAAKADNDHAELDRQGVYDKIKAQLDAAGRFPDDVNDHYAKITADLYSTLGERGGMTAGEAWDRWPLQTAVERVGEGYDQALPGRMPTSKKVTTSLDAPLFPDIETLRTNPEQHQNAVDAVAADAGMKSADVPGGTLDARTESLVERMKDNLLYLHDMMPEDIRARAKVWYEGGQRFADKVGTRWGKTRAQAAGMVAALSPQKDWFMNVTLAERVGDIAHDHGSEKWNAKMTAAAFRFLGTEALKDTRGAKINVAAMTRARGQTLDQLLANKDKVAAGIWLRAYDEAHHSTSHAIVAPEGTIEANVTKQNGEDARRAWGDYSSIGKAALIYADGSPENISQMLGGEHKVRNFYNNIFDPSSPFYTTIDTHAVAAAQLRPLSGTDKPVTDNFGSTGGDNATGISGSYPLYYEAYKRAAAERGILPREMQSITWEGVRGLFPEGFKNAQKTVAKEVGVNDVDKIWQQVDEGKLSAEDARKQIVEKSGGMREPDWWQHKPEDSPLHDATYKQDRGPWLGDKVTFEVAPNPDNAALKARWDALPREVQGEISHQVTWDTVSRIMYHFDPSGTQHMRGELHEQLGGYGDDTNPSLSIWLKPELSAAKADLLTRVIGFALEQKGMMRTAPDAFTGGTEGGVIAIRLPEGSTRESIEALYSQIRTLKGANGEPLVGGHTTDQTTMAILNDESAIKTPELAQKIAELLPDLDVGDDRIHVQFLDAGSSDYGISRKDKVSGFRAEPPVRKAADQFRQFAQSAIESAISGHEHGAGGDQGRSAGAADAGSGTDAGRVEQSPLAYHPSDQGTPTTYKQAARGAYDPSTGTLALLKDANLTTFVHELGHHIFEMFADLAGQENAPPGIARDFQKMLDWVGVKDIQEWQRMTAEERRGAHEQFAEGFEKYLAEGKAPSVELQGIFSRVRSWMLQAYQSLTNMKVELTDEVRGVFDRLLASKDAIEQAESVRGYEPLFKSAKDAGMTPEQWASYLATGREATQHAIDEMQDRSVRDMRFLSNAKSKALKEAQATADGLRAEARIKAAKQIYQDPIYQAWQFLTGKDIGKEAPGRDTVEANVERQAGKIDRAQAVKLVGETVAGKLDALHMLREGGMDPHVVAELHGLSDGQSMMKVLATVEHPDAAIAKLADQMMVQEHGEMATPDAIERVAEGSIHNDARAKFMATGLSVLLSKAKDGAGKVMVPAKVLADAAKAAAEKIISAKKISDLSPVSHLAAEARANKNAIRAAVDDPQAALNEQRASLLNNRLYRAATDAVTDVTKGLKYLGKMDKADNAKIGVAYREQILALLDRFDLRKSVTNKEAAQRQDLRTWIQDLQAQGYEPNVAESIANEAMRKPYKDMTVEEFRGLVDAVKSIEFLGRKSQEITDGNKARDLQGAATEAFDNMRSLPQKDVPTNRGLTRIQEKWLALKSTIRSADASLLKMEQVMDWLDKKDSTGVLNRIVFRPIAEGLSRRTALTNNIAAQLRALHESLPKDWGKDFADVHDVPELSDHKAATSGARLTKSQIIAIALNSGTESNFNKVAEGEGWDRRAVEQVLDRHMTRDDWTFVEGVWKIMHQFWPDIVALERRMGNVAPDKVEGRTVHTKFGDIQGGYYPMVYDRSRAYDVDQRADRNADALFENSYTKASTPKGHTIQRTGYSGPVLLSLDVIPRHLAQVAHDLTMREPIINADKLLQHPHVRSGVEGALGMEYYKQFRPWLQSIANDRVFNDAGTGFWDDAAHWARTTTTMVGLGLRFTTMVIHGTTAAANSMGELGPVWMAKGANAVLGGPQKMSDAYHFITDRSPEMANRMREFDRDVRDGLRDIEAKSMSGASGVLN